MPNLPHVQDCVIPEQSSNGVTPAGSATRHNLVEDGTLRATAMPQSPHQASRDPTRTRHGAGGSGSFTQHSRRHPMWGSSNPVMVAMDFDVKWEKRLMR
jgi:hypothetical protein